MQSSLLGYVAIVVLLALLCRPVAAREAAPPSDGDRAVALGNEGIELFERGQWGEALERFRRAEALYHSPVFVVFMARSLRAEGRLSEARVQYQKVVDEELAADANQPFMRAQADAREELVALEREIPRLMVVLQGASPAASVTLDGRAIRPAESVQVDPGVHAIEVRAGERRARRSVTLSAGAGEVRVTIDLADPAPPGPPVAATPAPSAATEPPVARADSGLYTPGLVVSAAGGVALVAGGVFGVLALQKKSDNERRLPGSCQDTLCPDSERRAIEARNDRAKRLGLTADMLFVGGAVLTAAGVSLLILHPGDETRVEAGILPRAGYVRVIF